MRIVAKAKLPDSESDPYRRTIPVRAEAGRPGSFACYNYDYSPCGDEFVYWTGYKTQRQDGDPPQYTVAPMNLYNAYFLLDIKGNLTYGHTGTSVTGPANNVAVLFKDQTLSGPDYAGYMVSTRWWTDQSGNMPSGPPMQATLKVHYDEDPDWGDGEVEKTITYRFENGSSHVLVPKPNYEARFLLEPEIMPLSVAPESTSSSFPKTAAGETPRLILLALTGSRVPSDMVVSTDEPSSNPRYSWRKTGVIGGGENLQNRIDPSAAWEYIHDEKLDTALEINQQPRFKFSLVNSDGDVASEAAFAVNLCPRTEHLTATADPPPGPCNAAAVPSENGVISELVLNQPGSQRGYMGIELTTAPAAPGDYYILVESLDKDYRIRRQADAVWSTMPDGEFIGGFVLCTVSGAEILDGNFRRVESFDVNEPKIAYVRYVDGSEKSNSFDVSVITIDDENVELGEVPAVALKRLGTSSVFLSDPINLKPVWLAESQPTQRSARDNSGYSLVVPPRVGIVKATSKNSWDAKAVTKSGKTYALPMGLELPLAMAEYRETNGKLYRYVCSPHVDYGDCGGVLLDPNQITWSLRPNGVDSEEKTWFARMEHEPDPNQWFIRGIRVTTDKLPPTENGGKGGIRARGCYLGDCKWAGVEVTRPSHLECCMKNTCACKAKYNGVDVDVEKLVIDQADINGIPPQYLMAQVEKESGDQVPPGYLNTYSFRYEPTSRDFKMLVGDWRDVEDGSGNRNLTKMNMAFNRLGILNVPVVNGKAEYLPCEMAPAKWNQAPQPCPHSPDTPPASDTRILVPVQNSDTLFDIPDTGPDGIQLGVECITCLQGVSQVYPENCSTATLTSNDYCVFGPPWRVRFGTTQGPGLSNLVSIRNVVKVQTLPNQFGSLIGDPAAALLTICRNNKPEESVPCDRSTGDPLPVNTTLRTWAIHRGGSNPIAKGNLLIRYGYRFGGDTGRLELFNLLKNDYSFEVQAQWFASSSYGLMQILPDDCRSWLASLSTDLREKVKMDYYNPMTQSPIDKLFDPNNNLPIGALYLKTKRKVTDEGPDAKCLVDKTQCTWDRWWSRLFCAYNGSPTDEAKDILVCDYAKDIIEFRSTRYTPQP